MTVVEGQVPWNGLPESDVQLPLRVGHDGEILDAAGECYIVVDPNRELADAKVTTIATAIVQAVNARVTAIDEARLRSARQADPNAQPEGTLDALIRCAQMLETWGPECFPADEAGQVHFARCMMDATAAEIRAYVGGLS